MALGRFPINVSSSKAFNHSVASYVSSSGNKYAISAVIKTFSPFYYDIYIGNHSEVLIVNIWHY